VFVFDMAALRGNAALDAVLAAVMSSTDVIKTGCSVRDDAKMLARSFLDMRAFKAVAALLDLAKVCPFVTPA
jgi:hypothetical protein